MEAAKARAIGNVASYFVNIGTVSNAKEDVNHSGYDARGELSIDVGDTSN